MSASNLLWRYPKKIYTAHNIKVYTIKTANKDFSLLNNEFIKNRSNSNEIIPKSGWDRDKNKQRKIYDLLHFHILQKENLILLNKVFIKITPKRTIISIAIVVDGKNKVNYFLIYNALIPTDTIVNVF